MKKTDPQTSKKRYVGLDVFRVMAALVICAFHTLIHLDADYGFLQDFIRMGAVFMTGFFMLSGYVLFINHADADLIKAENLKPFWIKRALAILPMYYITAFLSVIIDWIQHPEKERILRDLIMAPAEILCIQSTYESLFPFSHNGGTWFISCIVICYLLYPFIQEVVRQCSVKTRIILLVLAICVLLYSPLLIHKTGISGIYSNPFFRCIEFCIGVTLASLKPWLDGKKIIRKFFYHWITALCVLTVMVFGVTIAVRLDISVGNYMLYNWVCLPCFIVLIVALSGVGSEWLERSKVLSYCVSVSYVFFLSQLFSNRLCQILISKAGLQSNLLRIALGWAACIVITVALHELLEKPITSFRKRRHR